MTALRFPPRCPAPLWSLALAAGVLATFGAGAPLPPEIENEQVLGIHKEAPHATLMPYANLAQALAGRRRESPFARDLNGRWKFNWVGNPADRPVNFYRPDFDVGGWKEIPVPSSWQLQGYDTPIYSNTRYTFKRDWPRVMGEPPADWPAYRDRNPVGSYRRDFEVPLAWKGRRVLITFDGVDSAFFLWVNGRQAGFSVDSRTPAEFDITDSVRIGEKNVLAVEVYRYSAGSYLECQDMWRLSGIFRNVTLWSPPELHIRDFFAKPDLDAQYQNGSLDVTVKLRNQGHDDLPKTVRLRLFGPDGQALPGVAAVDAQAATPPGSEKELHLALPVPKPLKWSAETPNCTRWLLRSNLLRPRPANPRRPSSCCRPRSASARSRSRARSSPSTACR